METTIEYVSYAVIEIKYYEAIRSLMNSSVRGQVYPFSAIVGQGLLKKALLLNAVDPDIAGVLIRGERGTAKSTAVRALAALLPEQDYVAGCLYNCDPADPQCEECLAGSRPLPAVRRRMRVIELPVSATEDKVVGTLDLSAAIKRGERRFEPGLLAAANRNILYVDEVNLLNDHIVDVLLDSAAMGLNTVEREGISFSHPANFILVGTMNPEEGELRPQLLDRFGLCVTVTGLKDPEKRLEVVRRLMEYQRDPAAFKIKWQPYEELLAQQVVAARKLLPDVRINQQLMEEAVQTCLKAGAEGHRADLTLVRTAKALAAYAGRTEVTAADVKVAATLVLAHRSRDPPSPPPEDQDEEPDEDKQDEHEGRKDDQQPSGEQQHGGSHQTQPQSDQPSSNAEQQDTPQSDGATTTQFAAGEEYKIKHNAVPRQLRIDGLVRDTGGRRAETQSDIGRYVDYRIPHGKPTSIAFDATLRAAALHQNGPKGNTAVRILPGDVREKVKERKTGTLIVFCVDASGSMGAEDRMTAVKGAVASLLTDAYQKRDRVALIVFRGDHAETVLPPTNSVTLAKERMDGIPTGGRTPLADGLITAHTLILQELRRDPKVKPLLVVVSDGRANVGRNGGKPMEEVRQLGAEIGEADYPVLVLDSETGLIKLGFAAKLAQAMQAKYLKLEELRAENVSAAVGYFTQQS